MNFMKQYIQTIKNYFSTYKKQLIIAGIAVIVLASLITAIVLIVRNSATKIVYQPANACGLLTLSEAKELLGSNAIHSGKQEPILKDDAAISKCGYADGNPDVNNMVIAAIIVRSGVNDKGTERNKKEFDAGRPTQNVEIVKSLGDNAYFNKALGQLNILKGRDWIILSFGVGSAPSTNTLDDALKLSDKILQKSV